MVKMSAVNLVVKSNFKRNKLQNILVGMVVAVCALIMSTGFATFGGMFSSFDSMYNNQNAADIMMILDESLYDSTEEYNWWKNNEDVSEISELIPCTDNRSITHEGEKLSSYSDSVFFAVKYPDSKLDRLIVIEGAETECPGADEVWIPTSYAKSYDIAIDDIIEVPAGDDNVNLKVTGIVVDPYYSSGFIYPYRFWTNENTYDKLVTGDGYSLISVKVKDGSKIDFVWKEYTEHLDNYFVGTMLDINSVRFAYLIMTGIICGVLLVFSIFILVITLYVVTNALSVSILSDYTTIGILKAFGFTSKQVRNAYVKLYGSICTVSIIIGVIVSLFLSKLMLYIFGKSMGVSSNGTAIIIPYMIFTFVILFAISVGIINGCANQAKKVSAVQAIKFGAPPKSVEKKRVTPKIVYSFKSVTTIYAIKQMLTNPRQVFFMLISSFVTVVVVVFSVNVFTSIQNMDKDMSVWGMDKSDVRVELNNGYYEENQIIDEILVDERVDKASAVMEYFPVSIEAVGDIASTVLVGNIYEKSLDDMGLENIEGCNPSESDEISLGVNTAKKYGVSIGEKFSLVINGKKLEFIITGIFQTASNTGNGYRLTAEGYNRCGINFQSYLYAVILKDNSIKTNFINDYSKKYKDELTIEDSNTIVGGSISSITTSVGLGVFVMSALFIIILMIIIANVVTLYVQYEKRNYGILKVCGMTPFQLHFSLVKQMWIILLLSMIIGIPAAIKGTPVLMSLIMSNMGMVRYPIATNILLTLEAMVILFVAISVVFWNSTARILKINARELISE